jgi:hypothetical protein
MMQAKQKPSHLGSNSNLKRQKTIEPDDTLESPSAKKNRAKLGKPPVPSENNRSGK